MNLTSFRVNKTLDDSECLQRAGNKPATLKLCTQGKVCPKWHIGAWKGVSMSMINHVIY